MVALSGLFIEVLEFYDQNGREPSPDTLNIAERKLGARFVGIRADDKKRAALAHLDDVGLLDAPEVPDSVDVLLEEPEFGDDVLGNILSDGEKESDLYGVSILPTMTRKSADSVAKRKKAKNFDQFRGLFKKNMKNCETAPLHSQSSPAKRLSPRASSICSKVL